MPLGRSREGQAGLCCWVFFLTCENPARVLEDDTGLMPVIGSGTAVNDPRQVRDAQGRGIMGGLKGLGALVASHQVQDTRTNLGCRILVDWSGRCRREPRADIPCRSVPETHEEGKGSPS